MTHIAKILDHAYRIDNQSPELDTSIETLLSGFLSEDDHAPQKSITITKENAITGFEGPISGETPEEVAVAFEQAILRDALNGFPGVTLHAAAVEVNGQVVLIAGPSGAGKTTVTLELTMRGCRLFSDEAAPLDEDTGHVHPFPRCLAASPQTIDRLGISLKEARHTVLNGQYCISPTAIGTCVTAPQMPERVCFISRGEVTRLSPVSNSEGIRRLMQLTAHHTERNATFEAATRLAETASFQTLVNGCLDQTIEALLNP